MFFRRTNYLPAALGGSSGFPLWQTWEGEATWLDKESHTSRGVLSFPFQAACTPPLLGLAQSPMAPTGPGLSSGNL